MTGGLIDDERGPLEFRVGRVCVDQVLKEKMQSVCGFYRFGEGIR